MSFSLADKKNKYLAPKPKFKDSCVHDKYKEGFFLQKKFYSALSVFFFCGKKTLLYIHIHVYVHIFLSHEFSINITINSQCFGIKYIVHVGVFLT